MLNVNKPKVGDYRIGAEVIIDRNDAMFLTPEQLRSRVLERFVQDVVNTILLNIDEIPVTTSYEEGNQFLTYRLQITLKGDMK